MTRLQTDWIVRKRDGRIASFDMNRIGRAMENAFRAELNLADSQPLDEDTSSTPRMRSVKTMSPAKTVSRAASQT